MPRKASGNFNQTKYINEWAKENMKAVRASYKKEFVEEFEKACEKLGLKKSQVIRQVMEETIKKAEEL